MKTMNCLFVYVARITTLLLATIIFTTNVLAQTNDPFPTANDVACAVIPQPDGKVVCAGYFSRIAGQNRNYLARLNSDGSLDSTINVGLAYDPVAYTNVQAVAIQSDGKIIFAGQFKSILGQARTNICRINPDGTLDLSYNPGTNFLWCDGINCLAFQPDGKLLVGGSLAFGQTNPGSIARFNVDGSVDPSFHPNGDGGPIHTIALQTNGQILIGGYFQGLGAPEQTHNYVGRLNADGSVDNTFRPNASGDGVYCFAVQPDNKIIVAGSFTYLQDNNGIDTQYPYIARLNPDGSLDASFTSPNPGGYIYSMLLQSDGKILIGGNFTSFFSSFNTHKCIARLNSNGSLDETFIASANATVYSLTIQADGKILLGGGFTSVNALSQTNIGRLFNNAPAAQNLTITGGTTIWSRSGTTPEVQRATFEVSDIGLNWTNLGAGTRVGGGWQLPGVNLSASGLVRARGYISGSRYNGSAYFVETILTNIVPPQISQQPTNRIQAALSSASFTVGAWGSSPLIYQWHHSGTNLTDNLNVGGSLSNVLTIGAVRGSDTGNYQVVVTNVYGAVTSSVATLTIIKATSTITWTNPQAINYGTVLTTNQLSATASVPGSFVYNPPSGTILNAGTNTLLVVFIPTDQGTYNSSTATVSQVVLRTPLTVSANNTNQVYGYGNPGFSGTVVGLTNSDYLTATYTTTATNTSAPGTYPIHPVLVDPFGKSGNYQIAYIDGILTVTPGSNSPTTPQIVYTVSGDLTYSALSGNGNLTPHFQFQGDMFWWDQPYTNTDKDARSVGRVENGAVDASFSANLHTSASSGIWDGAGSQNGITVWVRGNPGTHFFAKGDLSGQISASLVNQNGLTGVSTSFNQHTVSTTPSDVNLSFDDPISITNGIANGPTMVYNGATYTQAYSQSCNGSTLGTQQYCICERPSVGLNGSSTAHLQLAAGLILPRLQVTPNPIDFGEVPERIQKDMDVVIQNTGDASSVLTGQIQSLTNDFYLDSSNANFTLNGGDSRHVTLHFLTAYNPANFEKREDGMLRFTSNDPDFQPLVPLTAFIKGPEPKNFVKRRASSAGEFFRQGGDYRIMVDEILWDSSSGVGADLQSVTIREITSVSGCYLDSATPAAFHAPDPFQVAFANGWNQNGIWTGNEKSPAWPGDSSSLPAEKCIGTDVLGVNSYVNPPLTSGSFSILQRYQWTAPWKQDSLGTPIWTDLLDDTTTFQIFLTQGGWQYNVSNQYAGNLVWPLSLSAAVTIQMNQGSPKIRFFGPANYQYNIERATNLIGPWNAITPIPISVPSNGLFNFIDSNSPPKSGFYRLKEQ